MDDIGRKGRQLIFHEFFSYIGRHFPHHTETAVLKKLLETKNENDNHGCLVA
jgi:hypothetical protein